MRKTSCLLSLWPTLTLLGSVVKPHLVHDPREETGLALGIQWGRGGGGGRRHACRESEMS